MDLTRDEMGPILRDLHAEMGATIERYENDERYEAADAAEAGLSIASKFVLALVSDTSPLKPLLQLAIAPLVSTVTSVVESAVSKSRTPTRLRERIEDALADRDAALSKAASLENSPEREFMERFRIRRLRRRADELLEKADRLTEMLGG